MKKLIAVLVAVLMLVGSANVDGDGTTTPYHSTNVNTAAQLSQNMQGQGYANANAEGGEGGEGGEAGAYAISGGASISTNSTSNYKTRMSPISMIPPYLPYWQHGGWGTVKAYFPNGPNSDDQVYERTFNPDDPDDMRELSGVLKSLPYDGPLNFLRGILNSVGSVFGGPDNFHHGRGFEIASSLIRTRRPRRKPLLVFIDSNVNRQVLKHEGYAYVGKISLEGKVDRNWDHVYDAAVAEALLWDVDILLISGGMKGVTVGSNLSFPGAAGAYGQSNYSLSLLGGASSGITEGKGEALVSAEGYRYYPEAVNRRRIPQAFYDRIHLKPQPAQSSAKATQQHVAVAPATTKEKHQPGVKVSQRLYEMARFGEHQTVDYMAIK